MGDYSIAFARSARKELEGLSGSLVRRIFPRIEALVEEPRPRGVRKLEGEANLWRIRVGDYRVLYAIDDERRSVDVIAIRHRSEAYR